MKTRQLVNGLLLSYELQWVNNPRLTWDGKAFARPGTKDAPTYEVTINRAFFQREAEEILNRLQGPRSAEPTAAFLARLSADLNDPGSPRADGDLNKRLTLLQTYLEDLAWRGVYDACRANQDQPASARRCFRDAFVAQRIATIEEHEVEHLIDLATRGDDGSAAFARFTELNAFYAELLRGDNPLDTLSQAFAGLVEEREDGRNLDFSTEKVRRVLQFLQTCPRYRVLLAQGEGRSPSPCGLELLIKMSRDDFAFAGRELRRHNQVL